MKLKLGDIEYRAIRTWGLQKLQACIGLEWAEVDANEIISDLLEAAYLEGKKAERERIRARLGLEEK